jgi:hypothetical protein
VRLEGLGFFCESPLICKLYKYIQQMVVNLKISSGIEPATFRFVAHSLKHYATACPQLFDMPIPNIQNYNFGSGSGRETWSLTLREEHRMRVLENRVLRLFEPKRDEVAGG